MEIKEIKANTRAGRGKSQAAKVRAGGKVPGVLYGGGKPPLCLEFDRRQFESLIQHGRGGEHAVVRVQVADQPDASTPALIKSVQHHPVRGGILHADFMRIRLDERIETLVPVKLLGQAPGIVEGGIIDHQLREIAVECLALEVPDELTVDISNLHLGDAIHVRDITAPNNVTILTDLDRPVVAVHVPRAVKEVTPEEAAAVEGEAAAEPEVIGERKEKDKDTDKEKEKDKDRERGRDRDKDKD